MNIYIYTRILAASNYIYCFLNLLGNTFFSVHKLKWMIWHMMLYNEQHIFSSKIISDLSNISSMMIVPMSHIISSTVFLWEEESLSTMIRSTLGDTDVASFFITERPLVTALWTRHECGAEQALNSK